MASKVEISRANYNKIKQIINESTCMAVAYKKVEEQFKLDKRNSSKLTDAVFYDYKYLKVID